jgi:tetratricopeptide (TPR) repeat protein
MAPDSSPIQGNLANVLFTMGKLDEADRALRRTVELDPTLVGAWYGWGLMLGSRGGYPGAAAKLEKVIALEPRHSGAREKHELLAHRTGL